MFERTSMRVPAGWTEAHTPKFTGAQRYVKEGLPKDSISYEWKTEKCDGEIKGPVWNDTIIDTDQKGKPVLNHTYDEEFKCKEIIDAARFRDALVSTELWEEGDGLESFGYAFDETWCWADEYKKHSTKVFNFLVQDGAQCCFGRCKGTHKFDEVAQGATDRNSGSDQSSDEESAINADQSKGFALCETVHFELALMRYHIRNCTGDQSDKLWRQKLFTMLFDEVEKLPKKNNGAARATKKSQEAKMNWLHAICVVLAAVDEWKDLIYNRVCDPDDLQPLVDISDRVSATMKHLISFETFNNQHMSKVLAFLTMKMESVARTFCLRILKDFWGGEKPALFGGSRANGALSTCQKLVKTYAEKFTETASPPPPQVAPPAQAAAEHSTVQKSFPESKKKKLKDVTTV